MPCSEQYCALCVLILSLSTPLTLTLSAAYLKGLKTDLAFMDDGARTPRYTPYFVNSGFYYIE